VHLVDGVVGVDHRLRRRVEHRQRAPVLPRLCVQVCKTTTAVSFWPTSLAWRTSDDVRGSIPRLFTSAMPACAVLQPCIEWAVHFNGMWPLGHIDCAQHRCRVLFAERSATQKAKGPKPRRRAFMQGAAASQWADHESRTRRGGVRLPALPLLLRLGAAVRVVLLLLAGALPPPLVRPPAAWHAERMSAPHAAVRHHGPIYGGRLHIQLLDLLVTQTYTLIAIHTHTAAMHLESLNMPRIVCAQMTSQGIEARLSWGQTTTLPVWYGNVASRRLPGAVRPSLPHGQLVVRVVVGHDVQLDLPQAVPLRRGLPVPQPLQVAQPVPAQGRTTTSGLISSLEEPDPACEQSLRRLLLCKQSIPGSTYLWATMAAAQS